MEGSYKNKKIIDAHHFVDDNDNDVLAILADDVFLRWVPSTTYLPASNLSLLPQNLSENRLEKSVNVGVENVKRFAVDIEEQQLFLMTENLFKVMNFQGASLFELPMRCLDMVFERSINAVSVLVRKESSSPSSPSSSAVITLSSKNLAVISAVAIANSIQKILYVQLETR